MMDQRDPAEVRAQAVRNPGSFACPLCGVVRPQGNRPVTMWAEVCQAPPPCIMMAEGRDGDG